MQSRSLSRCRKGVSKVAGKYGRAGMTSLSGTGGQVLLGKTYRGNIMHVQVRVPIAIQSINGAHTHSQSFLQFVSGPIRTSHLHRRFGSPPDSTHDLNEFNTESKPERMFQMVVGILMNNCV